MRNLHNTVSAKHARWDRVADTLASPFPKVAATMGETKTDVLAFTAFPKAH